MSDPRDRPTVLLMRVPLYTRDDMDAECWICGQGMAELEYRVTRGALVEHVGIHRRCIVAMGTPMVRVGSRETEMP